MTIEKVEELEVDMVFCEACGESEESDNSYWYRSYAYDDAYCDDCHHSMYESGEIEYCQGTCEELIWSEDIYICQNCDDGHCPDCHYEHVDECGTDNENVHGYPYKPPTFNFNGTNAE